MPAALSIRGLRKTYKDVVAVDGLDLEVGAGECFGLLGPNGAGKTTTIEICEGLNEPDSGAVRVLGETWESGGKQLRQRLGISLQETQFSEKLTVAETLQLFRSFYQRPSPLDAVLDAVQLGEQGNGRVGQLSGGQKQRLALAFSLVAEPQLFVTAQLAHGLDRPSRPPASSLIEGVKRAGRTVLITTHYMEEAEQLCDRVAIVDHGRIIALGTPRELIASLGAEHVVEFKVGGELDASALLALPGAKNLRRKDGTYLLEVSQAHRTVPALLEFLAARSLPLEALSTHSATLDDVFVHLTGRQLRDA